MIVTRARYNTAQKNKTFIMMMNKMILIVMKIMMIMMTIMTGMSIKRVEKINTMIMEYILGEI